MTGYGAGQATVENVLARVELRAVNHRFFDAQIRISRDHAGLETRVRELLAERIERGRISATVDLESEAGRNTLTLDERLADQYRQIVGALRDRFGVDRAGDAVAFAALPDLVRRETPELPARAVEAALAQSVGAALDQLLAMRSAEGVALRDDLVGRVGRIERLLDDVEREAKGQSAKVRQRLAERIANLVPEGTSPDPDRLATEVAILADKADIVEEVVRFRAHDVAFLKFLERDEAVGKRLDFLLQEMNREINTIGSKSVSAKVAHLVVEVKEEIERLREQVQNIE
ncbi:MAG: YicC/YloC family endoribonuclease [bacterium]